MLSKKRHLSIPSLAPARKTVHPPNYEHSMHHRPVTPEIAAGLLALAVL